APAVAGPPHHRKKTSAHNLEPPTKGTNRAAAGWFMKNRLFRRGGGARGGTSRPVKNMTNADPRPHDRRCRRVLALAPGSARAGPRGLHLIRRGAPPNHRRRGRGPDRAPTRRTTSSWERSWTANWQAPRASIASVG